MKRSAKAVWTGTGMEGQGKISTDSGAIKEQPYSFKTRFEEGVTGTNPEELVAAAHSGCYSMALTFALGKAGHNPESVETKATVKMEKQDIGWTVVSVHLDTTAAVKDIEESEFKRIAEESKKGCPISRLLNAEITLDAKLK